MVTARIRKVVAVACLFGVLLPGSPVLAETAGIIKGTVTDDTTHHPVAGVSVTAKSPSATYHGVTDAHGFYSFLSVLPDNYALSFKSGKYQPASSIVVVLNGSQNVVNIALSKSLRIIAVTHSHSAGSAFQRSMTIDTYTVTGQQIAMVQGKAFNNDENQLLRSIPSVTIDKSGTVSIRGGFAFEAAYEFEGIDYTAPTANLQNTLQNIGNFGLLNGVGSVQLIPGAGDATHGDTGTGLVEFTAKHGTYPQFFNADLEATVFPYDHQLGLEWGYADPSQRFSNYAGFIGVRKNFQYGEPGTAAATLGTLGTNAATLGSTIDPNLVYYAPSFLASNDFVDNAIYRFGKNQSQRLQFFIQSQAVNEDLDYGGFQYLPYISGGTQSGQCWSYPVVTSGGPVNSLAQNYACDRLIPLYPGQPAAYSFVSQPDQLHSPFLSYKLEYGANLGTTSVLTTRYYRTWLQQSEELPAQGIFATPYGGSRVAGQIDDVTTIGDKHTLKVGLLYQYNQPFGNRYDYTSYTAFTVPTGFATYSVTHPYQMLPSPYTYTGLLPNNNPYDAAGLEEDFFSPAVCNQIGLGSRCGYLSSYFPNGTRFPYEEDISNTGQQVYGLYGQDTIEMSRRWKTELGLRLDGYNFQSPQTPGEPAVVPVVAHQRLYEPHYDLSYAPGNNDTIRFGFGHTLSIPLPSQVGGNVSTAPYAAFESIPSYDNQTGAPATYCGINANQRCASYAQQLYWLTRDYHFGSSSLEVPLTGATFTNIDLSWAHEFRDGAAFKLTPFYRRGYNVIEQTAQIIGFNEQTGYPIFGDVAYSNLGIQKAYGVEALYNQQLASGLSMQIGATYISQFGNEPPGTYLQPAALALGVTYRSPDLSPFQMNAAFDYKTKTGFHINPVIGFNVGYPYGQGYYTAVYCDGKPVIVPSTSLSTIFSGAPGFIDPLDPGSCTAPNIAATRGVREPGLAGGLLTTPRVEADITFEYTAPHQGKTESTFGLQVKNLFNQLYNVPVYNGCYGTPVTTGLATGNAPCTFNALQYQQPDIAAHPGAPYLTYPNLTPLSFRLYWQVNV